MWSQSGFLATCSPLWLIVKNPAIMWSPLAIFPVGLHNKSMEKLARRLHLAASHLWGLIVLFYAFLALQRQERRMATFMSAWTSAAEIREYMKQKSLRKHAEGLQSLNNLWDCLMPATGNGGIVVVNEAVTKASHFNRQNSSQKNYNFKGRLLYFYFIHCNC